MGRNVKKLTRQDHQWVASQLRAAITFVNTHSPDDANKPLDLHAFDRAFAGWLATNEENAKRIHEAMNCVGIAFGQFLVNGLGLDWVTVTNEQGSNLAVYGLPDQGDVLIYPVKVVTKRWEARETNFLNETYNQISRQVTRIARTTEKKKPWWKVW